MPTLAGPVTYKIFLRSVRKPRLGMRVNKMSTARSSTNRCHLPNTNKKSTENTRFSMLSSVPETIRTSDPSLRRRVLYPLSYEDIYEKSG